MSVNFPIYYFKSPPPLQFPNNWNCFEALTIYRLNICGQGVHRWRMFSVLSYTGGKLSMCPTLSDVKTPLFTGAS